MDDTDRAGPGAGTSPIELWSVDLASATDLLIDLGGRLGLAPGAQPSQDLAAIALHRARTAARVALRLLLVGHIGLAAASRPFVLARGGKPSLAPRRGDPAIEFSLAHCEAAAVIAISRDGPVGVDVEAPRQVRISAHRRAQLLEAARSLAPGDRLPDGPGEAQFLQAWVRLEALAKVTGEGLGALLGRLDDRASPPHATSVNGAPVCVRDIGLGGHSLWAAVAGISATLADARRPEAIWLPLDRDRLERLGRGEPVGNLPFGH